MEKHACGDIAAKWYCIAFSDTFKVKCPVKNACSEDDCEYMATLYFIVPVCIVAIWKQNVWWVVLKG